MKIAVILLIIVAAGVVSYLLWGHQAFRFVRSAVLIIQAQPYERVIQDAPTILIVGDSTAYGTGARRSEDTIAGRIAHDHTAYSIVNKGKNGQTVRALVETFQEGEMGKDNALILIQIGGNDILQFTDLSLLRKDVQELFILAKQHAPRVIVMTSGNVGGASAFAPYGSERSVRYEQQTRAVRDLFIEEAEASGVLYVDLLEEPHNDVFIQKPERYLASDGLHPSSEGYGVWYEHVRPVVEIGLKH